MNFKKFLNIVSGKDIRDYTIIMNYFNGGKPYRPFLQPIKRNFTFLLSTSGLILIFSYYLYHPASNDPYLSVIAGVISNLWTLLFITLFLDSILERIKKNKIQEQINEEKRWKNIDLFVTELKVFERKNKNYSKEEYDNFMKTFKNNIINKENEKAQNENSRI